MNQAERHKPHRHDGLTKQQLTDMAEGVLNIMWCTDMGQAAETPQIIASAYLALLDQVDAYERALREIRDCDIDTLAWAQSWIKQRARAALNAVDAPKGE